MKFLPFRRDRRPGAAIAAERKTGFAEDSLTTKLIHQRDELAGVYEAR
ncbi:MAG: hypothetical protein R3C09_03970 [Pirellulaceae bacterium]